MATHTPGPWRVRDEDGPPLTDVMVSNRLLATAYPVHRFGRNVLRSYAEAEANARLIAAAPEMWEALVGLLTHFRKPRRDEWINDTAWKLACDAVARAEAVVAKAEGRE